MDLTTRHPDNTYQRLAHYVLRHGKESEDRTGVGTYRSFGLSYRLDLQQGFPLLTTKKINFQNVVAEILWYLSGDSDINELQEHTGIWDEWADADGFLETAYGRYWRYYPMPKDPDIFVAQKKDGDVTYRSKKYAKKGTPYEPFLNRDSKYVVTGPHGMPCFDQIRWVVDTLRSNPESRRMLVQAWYPPNAAASRLPPCHHSFVLSTIGGKLNIEVNQRSGDIAVGIPYNMAGYALLCHLIALEVGMEVGQLKHNITDAHIYKNHVDGLKKQLGRMPSPRPRLLIPAGTLFDFDFEDVGHFRVSGYNPHDFIPFKVAA